VQSSDAADRFGVTGSEPSYIEYYFSKDDLPEVEAELDRIVKGLGDNFEKIRNFFDNQNGYNDIMLANALGIEEEEKVKYIISEYADYTLGLKIRDHLLENDYCSFTAEL
jgi:hypothetical protein